MPREFGTLEYGADSFGTESVDGSGSGEDRETTSADGYRSSLGEDGESATATGVRTRKGFGAGADYESAKIPLFSESIKERLRDLTDGLPPWMPREGSKNEDLLAPVAHSLEKLEKDTEHVYNASSVQLSPTKEAVEKHAEFVDIERTTNNREVIKAKTKIGFLKNASQGTIPQLFQAVRVLLDVNISDVEFNELDPGVIQLAIPRRTIDKTDLTAGSFVKLMTEFCAAGYEVQVLWISSFENQTLEEYNNGDTNIGDGYNTLDANGNLVKSGGQYTTLDSYTL